MLRLNFTVYPSSRHNTDKDCNKAIPLDTLRLYIFAVFFWGGAFKTVLAVLAVFAKLDVLALSAVFPKLAVLALFVALG